MTASFANTSRTIALACCGLTLFASRSQAQTKPARDAGGAAPSTFEPIVIGTKTSLESKILGEKRPVMIYLPADYAKEPGRYPVIYLLDGDRNNFTQLVGIVQLLVGNQRMPSAIIVGVPNTKDRTHDLTPPAASDSLRTPYQEGSPEVSVHRNPTRGGAAKFRAFLTQELRPWVETHYHTAPYRILVGHSYGGLFTLDALAHEPGAFTAYIAMSPSLWWDDARYVKTVEDGLTKGPLNGKALYMTTGAREVVQAMITPAKALAAFLEKTQPTGLRWSFRLMPGELHGTNPHRSMLDAFEWLFAGFEMHDTVITALALQNDTTPIVRHYAEWSKRLGYPVAYPLAMLNARAHYFLTINRTAEAMRVFRFNVAHMPDSPTAQGGLADGLEATGETSGAVAAATKALQLATASHDAAAVTKYRTQRARLKKGR